MNFIETPLPGAFVITLKSVGDARGSFTRTFCQRRLAEHGIVFSVAQCNRSSNARRGTLRGMHFQRPPHEEAKLVRCSRGAVWDVIIDLRSGSSTIGRWYGMELSEANDTTLFVPAGFAHGFQTLVDDTIIEYTMSEFYDPDSASGVRWNDPAFGIAWPVAEPFLSDRDQTFPDWHE